MEQVYTPKQNYKVLVNCMTYNQSKYIEDALNGFAMQKTDFPFVCLVMDDASTDGEQEVIKIWMERECDMASAENIEIEKSFITLVPHKTNSSCTFAFYFLKENLYKKGGKTPMITSWREHCEYEAMCEGDDSWNFDSKLLTQVSFLDSHSDFSLTSGGFMSYRDDVCVSYNISRKFLLKGFKFGPDSFTHHWYTKTLTTVFRISSFNRVDSKIFQYKNNRDIHLFYYLLRTGKGYYFSKCFGKYNMHPGGICSLLDNTTKLIQSYEMWKDIYTTEGDKLSKRIYFVALLRLLVKGEIEPEARKDLLNEAKYLADTLSLKLCYFVDYYPAMILKLFRLK